MSRVALLLLLAVSACGGSPTAVTARDLLGIWSGKPHTGPLSTLPTWTLTVDFSMVKGDSLFHCFAPPSTWCFARGRLRGDSVTFRTNPAEDVPLDFRGVVRDDEMHGELHFVRCLAPQQNCGPSGVVLRREP
jgi:hypothetical protein